MDEPTPDVPPPTTLRRRKRRVRGYSLDTDDEGEDSDSVSVKSSCPSTPRDEYFPPVPDITDPDRSALSSTMLGSEDMDGAHSAREPELLPRYSESAERIPLSWGERMLDRVAPYAELLEAERVPHERARTERFDKVLARLLTEWYVVAASVNKLSLFSRSATSADVLLYTAARPRGNRRGDIWAGARLDIPR